MTFESLGFLFGLELHKYDDYRTHDHIVCFDAQSGLPIVMFIGYPGLISARCWAVERKGD